jgi:drug/metabolite transporter (DMT)-like permease
MLGDLIGLVSGIAFGLLILTLRGSSRVDAATGRRINWQILVYGNLLAAVIGMPALAGEAAAGKLDVAALLVLLWMGTGQLSFGYLAFQAGIRTTPALRASIISLAEPVLNPVLVFIVVGEVVTSGTIYGGTIVLVALLIAAALPKQKPA